MICHGDPPYLEASSKGDRRFSALYARIAARDFNSIEELYQSKKLFDGKPSLNWRDVKGKKADNQSECAVFYDQLWREYLYENPFLIPPLLEASGISDTFGVKGSACQATSLWNLRNEFLTTSPF